MVLPEHLMSVPTLRSITLAWKDLVPAVVFIFMYVRVIARPGFLIFPMRRLPSLCQLFYHRSWFGIKFLVNV